MTTNLWLQSDVRDPYRIYETRLQRSPVYWDEINKVWGVYSYKDCITILNSKAAHIPAVNERGLNDLALGIRRQLARVNNDAQHTITRQTAMLLFEKMKAIEVNDTMKNLLEKAVNTKNADWVDLVCNKLPVTVILQSFGFDSNECALVTGKMEQLVKIMSPAGNPEQIEAMNETVKEIHGIVENRVNSSEFPTTIPEDISHQFGLSNEEAFSYCVSNLIGLLIQGYDAGRGVLSNSLLHLLNGQEVMAGKGISKARVNKSVIETLRYDPPIHHTRRVAVDDMILSNCRISKNETIIVMLAAANRDPAKFCNPAVFDIERKNNNEHLTFGTGAHRCLANHFSVHLATEALTWFLNRYTKVELPDKNVRYEPLMNARLPQSMLISFT